MLPTFFLRTHRPPRSALFPYTTLFRSGPVHLDLPEDVALAATNEQVPAPVSPARIVPASVEATTRARELIATARRPIARSEEHTSELQSLAYLVCRLLLEKKKLILWPF